MIVLSYCAPQDFSVKDTLFLHSIIRCAAHDERYPKGYKSGCKSCTCIIMLAETGGKELVPARQIWYTMST